MVFFFCHEDWCKEKQEKAEGGILDDGSASLRVKGFHLTSQCAKIEYVCQMAVSALRVDRLINARTRGPRIPAAV